MVFVAALARVIDVLKDRVDPEGQLDITMVQQGRDQIEITMPLPSERVKRMRADFERELTNLERVALDAGQFERIMRTWLHTVEPYDDPERIEQALDEIVPDDPSKPYDMREVISRIVDDGDFFEVHEGLEEGELVVVHGAFRLDSELQIRGGRSMMNPDGGRAVPAHGRGTGTKPPVTVR
jgi:hypothetical protein